MLSAPKKTKHSENFESKVTQAELDALGATMSPLVYGGVDRYFKWRHAFLSLAATFFLARALFYPDLVFPAAFVFNQMGVDTHKYVQFRSLYVLFAAALYAFSYLRDWFFPQVALVIFALAMGGLIIDTLSFFAFYQDVLPVAVAASLTARLAVVVCLFYNAIYVHRAPAMPRHLWS